MPTVEEALEACKELERRLNAVEIGSQEWFSVVHAILQILISSTIRQVEIGIDA